MALEHAVEPNDPKHVLLHTMLRWFAKRNEHAAALPVDPDVVILRPMVEQEQPLQEYGIDYVRSTVTDMKRQGLVDTVEYHHHTLGYRLTDHGIEVLEEMGTPKQYDH